MPQWCTGEVIAKTIWTDGLFTLRVRVPGVKPFEAGQFLHLSLMSNGQAGVAETDGVKRINRPYSVASPHGDELEFFIVLVEDGELTPLLWQLQVGDKLDISDKGSGRFTLAKSPAAKNLWLVATGTGLAPYIAMLRTDEPWEKYQEIVVVHGARYLDDLAYTDELHTYYDHYPGRFHLVQALTREAHHGKLAGRIPLLFEHGELESQTGVSCQADDSTVLLCGNPKMLDAMEELLGKRDMRRHRSKSAGQIVLERYW